MLLCSHEIHSEYLSNQRLLSPRWGSAKSGVETLVVWPAFISVGNVTETEVSQEKLSPDSW